jgi:hypothetical protein
MRSHTFAWVDLKLPSSYLQVQSNWDYRCAAPGSALWLPSLSFPADKWCTCNQFGVETFILNHNNNNNRVKALISTGLRLWALNPCCIWSMTQLWRTSAMWILVAFVAAATMQSLDSQCRSQLTHHLWRAGQVISRDEWVAWCSVSFICTSICFKSCTECLAFSRFWAFVI